MKIIYLAFKETVILIVFVFVLLFSLGKEVSECVLDVFMDIPWLYRTFRQHMLSDEGEDEE